MKLNKLVDFLLLHLRHILQPMDVGMFQYLKNAHQRKLREALRKGKLTFNRRSFAGALQVGGSQLDLLSRAPHFTISEPPSRVQARHRWGYPRLPGYSAGGLHGLFGSD